VYSAYATTLVTQGVILRFITPVERIMHWWGWYLVWSAKFHPIGAGMGVWDPQNWRFYAILKFKHPQGHMPCTFLTKFSEFMYGYPLNFGDLLMGSILMGT